MTKKSNINLKVSWDKDVIPAKTEAERSLLIELKANESSVIKKKERQAVNLALVIDRSGSMQGSPIEAAKSAAPKAIDSIRLLEFAISLTLVIPAALSINISKPTFLDSL